MKLAPSTGYATRIHVLHTTRRLAFAAAIALSAHGGAAQPARHPVPPIPAVAAGPERTPPTMAASAREARPVVAIYEFRSGVSEIGPRAATDMFVTALVHSGRFRVMERARLNEGVVREKQLAVSAQSYLPTTRGPRLFGLEVTPAPGVALEQLEQAVYSEIDGVKAGPIANQQRVDHRHRKHVVRANAIRHGTADVRSNVSREFADYGCPVTNVDQQSTLDCSEKRNAIERSIAFEIRNAVVQKARGTPEHDWRLERPTTTPLRELRPAGAAADAEHCAALRGYPYVVRPECKDARS